mgnify:CR=1 FL=1
MRVSQDPVAVEEYLVPNVADEMCTGLEAVRAVATPESEN